MRVRFLITMLTAVAAVCMSGCSDDTMVGRLMGKRLPVEVPVLVTTDLPFKYPPGLYIQQIQGDVTLRLFIDSLGAVVRESTKVAESAKYDLLDSAAVDGAAKLTFRPARRGEHRIPFAVLFPVKFRVPNGPPLPQDTGHAPAKP